MERLYGNGQCHSFVRVSLDVAFSKKTMWKGMCYLSLHSFNIAFKSKFRVSIRWVELESGRYNTKLCFNILLVNIRITDNPSNVLHSSRHNVGLLHDCRQNRARNT